MKKISLITAKDAYIMLYFNTFLASRSFHCTYLIVSRDRNLVHREKPKRK